MIVTAKCCPKSQIASIVAKIQVQGAYHITIVGSTKQSGEFSAGGARHAVHLRAEQQAREPEPQVHSETTAAAIAFLDAQYPWLRGAEKRFSKLSHRAVCQ